MNTSRNRLVIVLSAILFVGGIIGFRYLGSLKTPPPRNPDGGRAALAIRAGSVVRGAHAVEIPLQGRVAGFDKVDLFSEVNGLALSSAHPFKEGVRYAKGETLIQLDDREARLALQGQRAALLSALTQILPDLRIDFPENYSAWQDYAEKLDPEKPLQPLPAPGSDRERYFLAARNIQTQYYAIRSVEERLAKYRIAAPFDGSLTATDVQLGTLVRPGQRIGQFLRLDSYELETNVALADMRFVRIGQSVLLTSEDTGARYSGIIRRIGEQVDPATQMLPVFVSVSGPGLREGMYLSGSVKGSAEQAVFPLPKDLLVNGTHVWTIRDSTLHLTEVETVRSGRETTLIKGLQDGDLFIREVIPGIYEGMKVTWTIE
jgi:membrane fusion protein (multidrug efflux system)